MVGNDTEEIKMRPSLTRFSRFLALCALVLGALGLMASQVLAQQATPSAKPETPSPEIQRRMQMGGYHPNG